MGGFYAKRHNTGQRVALSDLRVGMLVHLSYTNFGCVWRIASIETDKSGEVWLNLAATESQGTPNAQKPFMPGTFEQMSVKSL
ncbi:MAG: hypothetical protein A4S08_02040 [Proteobacteria bacterium SG_bin4]|nr:MAG: hypothetical protein A4S08_02040 [Proteobacteria bacterium SG_bin4]